MNDLDKKLVSIAINHAHEGEFGLDESGIDIDDGFAKEIRQAFIDDGWLNPLDSKLSVEALRLADKTMMTREEWEKQAKADGWTQEPRQFDQMGNLKINGQEWYDRFEVEVFAYFDSIGGWPNYFRRSKVSAFFDAAKKAAGIE